MKTAERNCIRSFRSSVGIFVWDCLPLLLIERMIEGDDVAEPLIAGRIVGGIQLMLGAGVFDHGCVSGFFHEFELALVVDHGIAPA